MKTSLARDLMSDEEWTSFERFILTVWAPNGRRPTNHRLVLDGTHRRPLAGPSDRVREVVQRFPAVSALNIGGAWRAHHGPPERERSRAARSPDDRQHGRSRLSSGSGRQRGLSAIRRHWSKLMAKATGFRPLKSVRWENGPPDRFPDHLPLNDHDPPPRHAHGPLMRTEITAGQTSDCWLRSGHCRKPSHPKRLAGRPRLLC